MIRIFFVLAMVFASLVTWGQAPDVNLFQSMRPDLMIVVRKHSLGTDTVKVTPLAEKYPRELLIEQVNQLATLLGTTPKGLQVESINPIPGNNATQSFQVSFGVDGLIKREENRLGLEPLARAFAKGPTEGKPNALLIQFESEEPSEKIWKNFANESVQMQGQADPRFGIEYRLKLLTSDPSKIVIPEGQAAQEAKAPPQKEVVESGPPWLIIGIIAVVALAVGALVYSLLLRPKPSR